MATEAMTDLSHRRERNRIRLAMARAEEYIDAHLDTAASRANLAAAAEVSSRTLSRGFMKRYGTGPMDFLKARRLYAAYRDLLAAEADSIRVFEVANRYGFNHHGKFAIAFHQAFGELPSVTLKHRAQKGRLRSKIA